jgi:uncharacterized protein YdeI (YjbR/CyaY-like superfamily)
LLPALPKTGSRASRRDSYFSYPVFSDRKSGFCCIAQHTILIDVKKRITPKSRSAWRTWLEAHHDSETEIWLVFFKRHTGKATLSYNDAVEEAVCFGWIDGIKQRIDDARYTHRFSPRRPDSKWSETNRKRAARMEKAELMTAAGRKAIAAARRTGKWQATTNAPEVDVSIPAALAAALQKNPKAAEFFESLSPSYQQQFTGWINIAKREQTRERRIAETITLLARGAKLGMR